MTKEKWKKCRACKIYTDFDEKKCPQYGRKEGHNLWPIELTELGIKRLYKSGKLLTKHVAKMEERFRK